MHLYLHIPFCRQACHYCDFHFSTQLKGKNDIINSLIKEIELQKDYLQNNTLTTIYLGGGTPSLLSKIELTRIFEKINQHFFIHPSAEITLEANPEDLNPTYLSDLKAIGINRLSIGIQSFQDKNLQFMHRNHSANTAKLAVKNALEMGFENISIDLIFGIPGSNMMELQEDIETALSLNVHHISAYSLIVEPNTVFANRKKKKLFHEIPDSEMAKQFEFTYDLLENNGFEAYEISSFAKNGMYSKHNSSYWMQEEYLGIGPSAHSYNGKSRQWNVSSNTKYMKALEQSKIDFELEILDEKDQFNEYIMTRLRTRWGIDVNWMQKSGNENHKNIIHSWIQLGYGEVINNHFILNRTGRLIADKLSSDIFIV